jgi:hypothetical protein
VSKSPLIWKKEKMMKSWKYALLLCGLSSLVVLLMFTVVGEAGRLTLLDIFLRIWRLIYGLAVLISLLALPLFLGVMLRLLIIEVLDEKIDPEKLTKWQHFWLCVIGAAAIGLIQIPAGKLVPFISSWVYAVYSFTGWPGSYETTPLGWLVYGFFASIIGYGLNVD